MATIGNFNDLHPSNRGKAKANGRKACEVTNFQEIFLRFGGKYGRGGC
jgi:hypothetical protein